MLRFHHVNLCSCLAGMDAVGFLASGIKGSECLLEWSLRDSNNDRQENIIAADCAKPIRNRNRGGGRRMIPVETSAEIIW